jgi:hypothetical protein
MTIVIEQTMSLQQNYNAKRIQTDLSASVSSRTLSWSGPGSQLRHRSFQLIIENFDQVLHVLAMEGPDLQQRVQEIEDEVEDEIG